MKIKKKKKYGACADKGKWRQENKHVGKFKNTRGKRHRGASNIASAAIDA